MIVIVYVSNNMTHYFQPLDLTVNAVAKHFLKDKFEVRYANEVKKQLDEGTEVYEIDILLMLSILKPIHVHSFWVCMTTFETRWKLSSTVSKVLGSQRLLLKNCLIKTRLLIWISKMFLFC